MEDSRLGKILMQLLLDILEDLQANDRPLRYLRAILVANRKGRTLDRLHPIQVVLHHQGIMIHIVEAEILPLLLTTNTASNIQGAVAVQVLLEVDTTLKPWDPMEGLFPEREGLLGAIHRTPMDTIPTIEAMGLLLLQEVECPVDVSTQANIQAVQAIAVVAVQDTEVLRGVDLRAEGVPSTLGNTVDNTMELAVTVGIHHRPINVTNIRVEDLRPTQDILLPLEAPDSPILEAVAVAPVNILPPIGTVIQMLAVHLHHTTVGVHHHHIQ